MSPSRSSALIIGITGTLGAAVAGEARRCGYDVIGLSRDAQSSQGSDSWPVVQCDLEDAECWRIARPQLVDELSHVGPLGLVVYAAGVLVPDAAFSRQGATRMWGVNVLAPYMLVRDMYDLLPPGCALILTGSASSHRVVVDQGLYGATKAAEESVGRWAAAALGTRGVRVLCVAPCVFRGGLACPPISPEEESYLGERHLSGRIPTAEDIAATIVGLAADRFSLLTGIEILVDGGCMLGYSKSMDESFKLMLPPDG